MTDKEKVGKEGREEESWTRTNDSGLKPRSVNDVNWKINSGTCASPSLVYTPKPTQPATYLIVLLKVLLLLLKNNTHSQTHKRKRML